MIKNLIARLAAKIRGRPQGLTLVTEERVYRIPRVQLHPLLNVYFHRADVQGKPPHILANFSRNGVGIVRNMMDEWPSVGSKVDGHLEISGTRHPLSFEIAHTSSGTIGGKVLGDTTLALRELAKAFPVEVAAAQMAEVNRDILKPEPDGSPRLFRNPDSCELYIVTSEDRLLRFQLSFFGNYIEGNEAARIKVGFLWSDDPSQKPQYKGSSTVRLSSKIPIETIDIARRLVEIIPGLESHHRIAIQSLLKSL